MDLELFVQLRSAFEGGQFLNSKEGQRALLAFSDAFEQFRSDNQRNRELSDRIRNIMREPNYKYPNDAPRHKKIVEFQPRKRRSKHPSEVWRLLSRSRGEMSNFIATVQRISATGEIVEPYAPCTVREWQRLRELDRDTERLENQLCAANLLGARNAQKIFLSKNVPMNFEINEHSVFFTLSGDYINRTERPIVDRVLSQAFDAAKMAYFPQPDVGNLHFGHTCPNVSESAFNDRFPVQYY